MAGTPRLGFPFMSVGQAQKEFTLNEALQTLDVLVSGSVEEPPRSSPPAAPALGSTYIVAADAGGDWAGKESQLAAWTSGGWRFIAPVDGMAVYERTSGTWALFRNAEWEIGRLAGSSLHIDGQQVVGARAAAIASPSGGVTVDAEVRAALNAVLVTLRKHGLIAP